MTIPITDKQVIPLFAVPLCKTRIEEPAPEIIDYLQNKISYTRMLHSVAMNSDDHNVLDREEVAPLRKALLDQVNEYLHNYLDADSKHEFYITTSWMNQYNKNDYSGLHYHSNSLIYLSTNLLVLSPMVPLTNVLNASVHLLLSSEAFTATL